MRSLTVLAPISMSSPALANQVLLWIRRISPGSEPAAHFLNVRMFPILRFPEDVVQSLAVLPDDVFHGSLISSTVHGYYYIRLIDDIVDGDRDLESGTQNPSRLRLFFESIPVWIPEVFFGGARILANISPVMDRFRGGICEDAMQRTVSCSDFERVSSRKFSAAGIPVVATCLHYGRADLVPAWLDLVDGLGRWSQMVDDILDWHQDRNLDRATYFLTEGERQRRRRSPLKNGYCAKAAIGDSIC